MVVINACDAGEQQWTGVVQQRDADVLQRAVPARLPRFGRVLRQRGPARQRTGVLPRGPGPADSGPRRRPSVPVLPAIPGPVRRRVRVRGHVAQGGLLQEERRPDQHVPGGRGHRRPRDVRAVRVPVAHPVGAVVRRHGRSRAARRQGPGRVQRRRRAHTRAPRIGKRSDTQLGQVSRPALRGDVSYSTRG